MKTFFVSVCIVLLFNTIQLSQSFTSGADRVYSFSFGEGSTYGQDSVYFPMNVIGMPDTSATEFVPAIDPHEVVTLGMGGEIILEFTDNIIIDGVGKDFTVFENAFKVMGIEKVFVEPAEIAVSKDGNVFYSFSYNYETLLGCAGVTPTRGYNDPLNPDSSGGDSFDLSELGIDSVRFVKINDISSVLKADPEHMYFDPTINGFDLDAVVAVNSIPLVTSIREIDNTDRTYDDVSIYPNPVSRSSHSVVRITFRQTGYTSISLYNVLGELLFRKNTDGQMVTSISTSDLSPGMYLMVFDGIQFKTTMKMMMIK